MTLNTEKSREGKQFPVMNIIGQLFPTRLKKKELNLVLVLAFNYRAFQTCAKQTRGESVKSLTCPSRRQLQQLLTHGESRLIVCLISLCPLCPLLYVDEIGRV